MKYLSIYTLLALSLSRASFSLESSQESEASKQEIIKISEAFGHLMGKNIESTGLKIDIQYVIQGLKNASEGKSSPMTEMECIQAITEAQQVAFKEQASHNLTLAEQFLENNKSLEGIVSLEEGKVQYRIEKKGTGDLLQKDSTPLIRYAGKFLSGEVFGSSAEDEPISLEEVIPGLKSGVEGMREGEKRIVYIHPDFAYGTQGALPPNSLLTFEIEIVKAQMPVIENPLDDLQSKESHVSAEIALPEQACTECVR